MFLKEAEKRAEKNGVTNTEFHFSLFEEFNSEKKYDYIFASYILEHVLDPVEVLKVARKALKDDGILFVIVPNANALSRQLSVHMGFYDDLKSLTENDIYHGHRRVYDRVDLNKDIEASGFYNISQGGIMLKILADFQMDKLIEDKTLKNEQLNGLYKLGMEYPDLCGSLFSILKKK